jgi:putative membrane protein
MISKLTLLVSSSALALATLNCGGGSTPSSNTPASSAAADGTGSDAKPDTTAATDTSADEHGGPEAAMPLTDQQIAAVTDSVNTAEIEQARLAQSKSTNDEVKRFAAMMIEHHGQAKKKQVQLNLAEAESPLSLKLAAQTHLTMEQLKQKTGGEFDRAYLQAQIDGHQKVLEAIDTQLLPNAKNPELKAYLESIRPTVADHLARAQAAQGTLASAPNTNEPAARASK